jgi:hypothetical protein
MKAIEGVLLAFVVAISTATAGAQQTGSASTRTGTDMVVKTITLRHLNSTEAMQLLTPYGQTAGGGVFQVPGVRAVTIREVPKVIAEMERVLAIYDRSPATVTLNFQLIAAENSGPRDPAVAGLDSLLRGVLKFSGYRLLRTTVANASENERVSQSLAADQETYTLRVFVSQIRTEGAEASVHLSVELTKDASITTPVGKTPVPGRELLSTGVNVPIGHTVVLGAAAADGGDRALILTVRPQLAAEKR